MTITPCLKKRYSTDNYGIINIRITENRKSSYISTKISVPERYWNQNKKEVRSNHPDSDSINQKLESKIETIKKQKDIGGSKELIPNTRKSFLSFFRDYLDRLNILGSYGTYKKYNTTIQHLEKFLKNNGKTDLFFSEIDYIWIEKFDQYLFLQNLKLNTRNNYLKCCQKLYNLSLKEKVFRTYENPFQFFKFRREPVEKRRLSSGMTQKLINNDPKFGSLLYETKNKFLIQLYGQGLRVSDLFTLRYKNIIIDGWMSRINFIQFKTKKKHSIQLTRELTELLSYYIVDKKIYRDMYLKDKYNFKINKKEYSFTYPELIEKLNYFKDKSHNNKRSKETWNLLSREVEEILTKIFLKQLSYLKKYSIKYPKKFIVPYLNEKYYENVEFNDNTRLTKTQYNHIQSKITVYNRNLKKLGEWLETNIRITSHTPRHTFTNLLLTNSTDVYSVSKSLGHQQIQVTENYINEFDEEKIDSDMIETFRKVRLQKIPLSPKSW